MKKNIIDLYHKARHENYPQKSGRVYSEKYTPLTAPIVDIIKSNKLNREFGLLPEPGHINMPRAEARYDFQQYAKSRTTNLDLQSHKQAWKLPYNPNPTQGFFPQANKLYSSQGFTSLDIETDDYGQPIAISATKFYRDENGQFRAVETFQRYYKSSNLRMQKTYPTHGLTRGILNKRRKEQGATYSEHYDWREKIELQKFLKNQIIVGHNIHEFDLPKLGLDNLYQSTIDTVTVARDIWTGQKNDLESVYQRIFGKTMAQAGFQHHDANADEIATMQILDAMMRKGSPRVRASLKYIEQHPEGVHFGTYNAYERSNLFTGNYNEYLGTSKIHAGGGRYIMTYDEDGNPLIKGIEPEVAGQLGMHEVELGTQGDIPNLAMSTIKELAQYQQSFLAGAQELSTKMDQDMNAWSQMKRGALIDRLSRMDVKEENLTLKGYTGMDNKAVRELVNKRRAYYRQQEEQAEKEREEQDYWAFSRAKGRRLRHELRHGNIDVGQFEKLSASGSWDKLIENLDKVTTKNEKYADALSKINISMYNFERLEGVFKDQVGGISSAFSNLGFKRASRIFNLFSDASMNALTGHYANLKYGMRATSAIGSGLVGAGMALLPANPLIGGAVSAAGAGIGAVSQIAGNAMEAGIVRWGQGIQNNFNTLALLKDMFILPFSLIKSTLHGINKSLHTFRGAINMTAGALSKLSGMGNPLTQMTGVGYGDYMGAVSADYASLLGKGTINSVYNDMATHRAGLYTTGDIDIKRLVAASMLGVYEPIYGTSTNEQGNLAQAINKLAADLKGQDEFQKKTTYALANRINPNMGSILQTMDTLGISRFEDLQRPAGMWGYSGSDYDRYRPRWQRAYWEYSYAGEQFGATRNRIATSLWNMVGKRGYNAVNRMGGALADALDTGKWENVGNTIKAIWTELKEGAENTWKSIQKSFGMSGNAKFTDVLKLGFAQLGLTIVKTARETIVPGILSVWDAVVAGVLEHSKGFLDWLSTIKIDWKQLWNNIHSGDWSKSFISSAEDATYEQAYKGERTTALRRELYDTRHKQKKWDDLAFGYRHGYLRTTDDIVGAMQEVYGYTEDEAHRLVKDAAVTDLYGPAAASYLDPGLHSEKDLASSAVKPILGAWKNMSSKARKGADAVLGTVDDYLQDKVNSARTQLGDEGSRLDIFLHDAKGNVTSLKNVLNNSQIIVRTSSDSRGNPVFNYVEKSSVKRSN